MKRTILIFLLCTQFSFTELISLAQTTLPTLTTTTSPTATASPSPTPSDPCLTNPEYCAGKIKCGSPADTTCTGTCPIKTQHCKPKRGGCECK